MAIVANTAGSFNVDTIYGEGVEKINVDKSFKPVETWGNEVYLWLFGKNTRTVDTFENFKYFAQVDEVRKFTITGVNAGTKTLTFAPSGYNIANVLQANNFIMFINRDSGTSTIPAAELYLGHAIKSVSGNDVVLYDDLPTNCAAGDQVRYYAHARSDASMPRDAVTWQPVSGTNSCSFLSSSIETGLIAGNEATYVDVLKMNRALAETSFWRDINGILTWNNAISNVIDGTKTVYNGKGIYYMLKTDTVSFSVPEVTSVFEYDFKNDMTITDWQKIASRMKKYGMKEKTIFHDTWLKEKLNILLENKVIYNDKVKVLEMDATRIVIDGVTFTLIWDRNLDESNYKGGFGLDNYYAQGIKYSGIPAHLIRNVQPKGKASNMDEFIFACSCQLTRGETHMRYIHD